MDFAIGAIIGFLAATILAIVWLLGRRRGAVYTVSEVRTYLEQFLNGEGNPYDWDDFLSIPIKDPYLDSIKNRANRIHGDHPPTEPGHWCSTEGENILKGFIEELKRHEEHSVVPKINQGEQGGGAKGD
tara:strand:- start:1315 stop:1701 length:387 start_codon:yes stop_codon:yes gene_type:complete